MSSHPKKPFLSPPKCEGLNLALRPEVRVLTAVRQLSSHDLVCEGFGHETRNYVIQLEASLARQYYI